MQPSTEGSLLEIIDLAHALRQEQLFINNEQNTFMHLNSTLTSNSENVSQLAWICSQQRQNLSNLIISKPDTGPSQCCRRANCLENAKFVPAHEAKGLKYQYVLAYTDLFNYLHRSPYLLAQCLTIGDRIYRSSPDRLSSIVETIISGLYDNVIHPKDVEMLLKLLQELIEIQIVDSDNPRRMFRTGSCAFSRLYHRLHESLLSAKLFLTASLYDPIMKVLIEDDLMLDIDPQKVAGSITTKERLKKFGQIGTPEYDEKLIKYTEETIELLFNLANRFIKSLVLNWSLFPSTLRWLVQSMCHILKRSHFSEKDINALLTEMIFTNFICPAVVSPDLYGIIDAPISENARFNLIQIGQILQMLALIKYEDVDPKMMELYKKFDRNIISNLLNQLQPNNEHGICILAMSANPNSNNIGRRTVLITQTELNVFVEFLRNILENDGVTISGEDRRKLGDMLERLPDKWENMLNEHQANCDSSPIAGNLKNKTRENLLSLQKKKSKILAKTISLNVPSIDSDHELPTSISLNGGSNHQSLNLNSINGNINNNHSVINYNEYEQVLSIPISVNEVDTKFQLLTEEQVLNMNNISNETVEPILTEKNVEELERQTEENEAIDGVVLRSGHQKHTRFSLSHDDASIGNTSDNLEAVSEAPSNHSVASSMELEENYQNDNLSDMVSANVSGRGTPNISGRDTPSSQVTEGENPRPSQIPTPQMAKILSKARSDIEDKFCKFEIKKLMEGDETISIISDTWSTDVLASDSETIEANDRDRNFSTPLIPSSVILPGDNNFDPLSGTGSQLRSQNLDVSETQSESAWSTDVLASDSEKMTEIDTDDNQSIAAKSDITDGGGQDQNHNHRNHRMNQAPDSPMFFTQRLSNLHFRTPESPIYQGRNNSSNASAINGDSGIGGVNGSAGGGGNSGQSGSVNDDLSFFSTNRSYADENYPRYAGSSISLLRHSRDHGNLHDLATSSGAAGASGSSSGDHHSHHRNHHHHHRRSHHHRASHASQGNDSSNTFLDCFDDVSYLTPPRHSSHLTSASGSGGIGGMSGGVISKRQNSIESNNSEISSNFDSRDENKKLFDYRKQTKDYVENTPVVHEYKPYDIETNNNNSDSNINNNNNNNNINNINSDRNSDKNSSKNNNNNNKYLNYDHQGYRRIDNNNTVDDDYDEASTNTQSMATTGNIIKTSTNLINPFDDGTPELILNANVAEHDLAGDLVEHRRTSSEHRNASFDGRRNGMIDYIANKSSSSSSPLNMLNNNNNTNVNNANNGTTNGSNCNTSISRSKTVSYENHEIILKKENQADDELILVKKTTSLNLNNNNNNSAINNNNNTSTTNNNNNSVSNNHNHNSIKHTGAIPKSISFDSSADKINGHHRNNPTNNASTSASSSTNNLHLNTHHNPKRAETLRVQGSGFFNKIKQGFKNRRGHKFRSLHDIDMTSREFNLITSNTNNSSSGSNSGNLCNGNIGSNSIHQDLLNLDSNYNETTEDILAKYRRKASSSSDAAASDSTGSNVSSSKSNKSNSDTEQHNNNLLTNDDTLILFNNAKRKLRIVLSSIDLQTSDFYHSCYSIASPLIIYLQIQLAQALNLNDLKQTAYVSEIIRCINLMGFHDHQKLLDEMHQDIFKRQTYIQYLIRYRQNLLTSIENLKRFEFRLQNDRELLNRHLIMVCVRMFLEKREPHIQKFIEKFQNLTIVDDKIDYLDECMIKLMDELRSDGILQGMADWQLQEARTCIERILLQRVYRQVMFPNDDGDVARDQVLREHIRKLSRRISPSHPNLRIPQEFLFEAPWPFAQQQMSYISAYKTPKGKVECVVRCVQSIMNLLSMASHRVPSADDLTPVLIYVIIKANPPHLLSTIDYVNSFIGDKLEGETQYWWTQFCSAVTFIKTMDYGE